MESNDYEDVSRHADLEEDLDLLADLEPVVDWLDPVTPPNWPVRKKVRVFVTNVDQTGQIYAYLDSDRNILDEMEILFTTVYGNMEDRLSSSRSIKPKWMPGEACVVFDDKTKTWNRGRVMAVS